MAVGTISRVKPLPVLGAIVDTRNIQGYDWWTDHDLDLGVENGRSVERITEAYAPDLAPMPRDRATVIAGYSGRRALVAVSLPRRTSGYDGAPIELLATTSNTTFGPLPPTAEELFRYIELDVEEANDRGYNIAVSPDVEARHLGVIDLDMLREPSVTEELNVEYDSVFLSDVGTSSQGTHPALAAAGVVLIGGAVSVLRSVRSRQ